MGYRQVHEAPGLELYQDKIQLSQDSFRGAFKGLFNAFQPLSQLILAPTA